jgi:proteasome lid subunit RPN8/RPN11
MGRVNIQLYENFSELAWPRSKGRFFPARPPSMLLTQSVFANVVGSLGTRQPEAAGILLGPQDDEPLATHFVLDESGIATSASFTLDVETLNSVVRHYRQCELTCVGIVHSHPRGMTVPSAGDLEYLEQLFHCQANSQLNQFLFPIFCDGRFHPFMVWRRDERLVVTPASLVLV